MERKNKKQASTSVFHSYWIAFIHFVLPLESVIHSFGDRQLISKGELLLLPLIL